MYAFGLMVTAAMVAAASTQPTSADGARPYRDLAIEAGQWIRASGVTSPRGLAWPAVPGDATSQNLTLYSGTPGIVLFLLELHRSTGRPEYLDEARAGADFLIASLPQQETAGLYTGVAGTGFTLLETYKATRDAKYRDGARSAVSRIQALAVERGAGVEWGSVTDIVGGAAGTGLFLLQAARDLDMPEARQLAARAGRRLLEVGVSEAGGTKWAMTPEFARLMPNFSHGTAGIAYFLATLYRETQERAFLDGALAGARYLKAVANTAGDMCLIFHHEPEEDGRKLFYLGWCHGPVGTARLWYRLWQVTGDDEWLAWIRRSARGVMASGIPERETPGYWNNVSQCCGAAGVAEFFLDLHRVTKDPQYLAFSRRMTKHLVEKATRDASGARWVQAEHRVRPDLLVAQTGWMQGAAGIGAWLLRLDRFEQSADAEWIRLPDSPWRDPRPSADYRRVATRRISSRGR